MEAVCEYTPVKKLKLDHLSLNEKSAVVNVYHYFKHQNPSNTIDSVVETTSKAMGYRKSTIYRVLKEEKSGGVTSPKPKPGRPKLLKVNVDEFLKNAIRKLVHSFFINKQIPTLDKVSQAITNDVDLPTISRDKLWKMLHELNFKFEKMGRHSMLIDSEEIVCWRRQYLRRIQQVKAQNKNIYYLDETWVNEGHCVGRVWKDKNIKSSHQAFLEGYTTGFKEPIGKGYRELFGIRNDINLLEHERQSRRKSECPIYIHEYSKIPSCSVTNKNFVNIGVAALKNAQIKSINNQNPKKMLNKLEETYWATWKPKKNKNKEVEKPKTPYKVHARKIKNEKVEKDNTPYGDVAGELIQYFNKPNFPSTGSVSEEKDIQSQYKIIPSLKPTVKITPFPEEINNDLTENAIDKQFLDKTVLSIDSNHSSDKSVAASHVSLDGKDESYNNNELKLFKHTDSFVINEKKKLEPKENHFQQPKCIKLYKKSGVSNYVKGGSYPLKMSKKKDLSSIRNFRLGPPGQLIVTGSSYNKTVK